MAGQWTTKQVRDANGVATALRVWDESGSGAGPFSFREQAIQGAVAITPHDTNTVAEGRQFGIVCTAAGDVKVQLADASTFTFPVEEGFTVLPWAVIQVFVTGTTATATYVNFH